MNKKSAFSVAVELVQNMDFVMVFNGINVLIVNVFLKEAAD